MIGLERQSHILHQLQDIHRLCPEMRFGQLFATIGMLGEDSTGHGLWDIEDDEFSAAVEQFASDLRQRAGASSDSAEAKPLDVPQRTSERRDGFR